MIKLMRISFFFT